MQTDYPADPAPTADGRPAAALSIPAAERRSPAILRVLADFTRRWIGPAAIGLLLFEGLIRTCIYSPRPQVADPLLGQMPAPGSTWVNGREGFGRVHWNGQGVRGRDLPPEDGGKVPRIIVMGDSYTRAESVHDGQTFSDRLERLLSQRLGREVWVGNCGRPANDAADYLHCLPAYEQKLRPDLTVIAFTLSDFRLVDGRIIPGVTAQFDVTAPPGRGLTVRPVSEPREHRLIKQHLPGSLGTLAQGFIDNSALGLYGAARLHAVTVKKPLDETWVRGVEQIATSRQMEQYLAALVARLKTPVACAYIDPRSPLQEETNGAFDRVAEQRLQAAAARLKIPFVSTGEAFHAHVARTGQPAIGFHKTHEGPGFGHLNPEGHRIVAVRLTPLITRLLERDDSLRGLRVAQSRARATGADDPSRPARDRT